MFQKIRSTLAVLLLAALFLPLSECSSHGDTPPAPNLSKTFSQRLFPVSDEDTKYAYGFAYVEWSSFGVVAYLAFAWPALLLFLGNRVAHRRFFWLLCMGELLLCAGTIYWLTIITAPGKWLYGAYVVLVLTMVYAGTALIQLWEHWRVRFVRPSLVVGTS